MSSESLGSLSFDRASIPVALRNLQAWPGVDDGALTEQQREAYRKRTQAIELFVSELDVSLSQITQRTGIDRKSIVRLFQRCAQRHADGRIAGFRALVPFNRLKKYSRIVPVPQASAGNAAGAFAQLLECYPALDGWLDRAARNRRRAAKGQREVRQDLRRIHKDFLAQCRECGITADHYPFNRERMAIRSLAAHLKRRVQQSFDAAAGDAGATHVRRAWGADLKHTKPPIVRPFEAVEFDGHKIDVRLTVKILDPFGFDVLLELGRIWILLILDVATRAVLGYALALGKEYSSEDVIEAVQAALTPHRARKLNIPGLHYSATGGMPSAVIPETAYACWDWFRCDNAKAHLADHTLERLSDIIGCWPDFGPPHEPNERPFVERFFSLLSSHFAHRLTGTTGSHAKDVKRVLGDPAEDTSLLIRLDELEELLDVLICDYNGAAHDGLGGRTPLEAMRHFIGRDAADLRTLARAHRAGVLLRESKSVTVRGNPKTGVRPYINFVGARYSSQVLSGNPALIGKELRIYVDIKDLRQLRAYFANGEELGVLTANRPWCFTAHSLRTRREILRLRARGKLRYREGDDAVEAYIKYKRKEALHRRGAVRDLAKVAALRAPAGHVAAPAPSRGAATVAAAPSDEPAAPRTAIRPSPEALDANPVEPQITPLRSRKAITF